MLPPWAVGKAVEAALAEDLGIAGDLTTDAIFAPGQRASGRLVARGEGIVAGLALAEAAFRALSGEVAFRVRTRDACPVAARGVIASIEGPARALLTGERVALNFLGHLSGIATLTGRYVEAVAGTGARIVCTRKTTPGLRIFEKYAVRAGGGLNHRFGLYDAVLIKDNHIRAAGGVRAAIAAVRAHAGHMVKVEIEVDTLDQLDEVLADPVDAVLLDNMAPAMLAEAVGRIGGRMTTEASGGVGLDTVRAIAEAGVDLISVGRLTHSAPTLDIGLDFD
ncbi:MAG: carboxylating nicotinate-nucleotide diphosphorylase [Hyphomicrobiaceae bacterium]